LPRSRVPLNFVSLAALAVAVGGCSNATEVFKSDQWFTQPFAVSAREDGSRAVANTNFDLGPRGAVAAEDLVGPDGRCSAAVVAAAPPAEPGAGSPMPASAGFEEPQVLGGIALGMSECDAVRRAGTPANVNIGAGENNDRRVVLTYLSGPWPGIYTFSAGRLKEISAAPVQARPAKPAPRKPAAASRPRTSPPTQIR
jgi:hypothetical protein